MTVLPLAPEAAPRLRPTVHKVVLEGLTLDADIGFHDFEVGTPQRLLVSIEVHLDLAYWPAEDSREASWNYDFIRTGVIELVAGRRFNLQETLAAAIFDMIASRPGVVGLQVQLRKPDVYPDAAAVGVTLSSG